MKSTELKTLWKLVKSGEKRPLTSADLAMLLRIRFALQEYDEIKKQVDIIPVRNIFRSHVAT